MNQFITQSLLIWLTLYTAAQPAPDIVFFLGSTENDKHSTTLYNGARQAQKDLQLDIEYIWSIWGSEAMLQDIEHAIEIAPAGIVITGNPRDIALERLIDKARNKGIIVTSKDIPHSKLENRWQEDGFGHVGQQAYTTGQKLGSAAFSKLNLKKAEKVIVWGFDGLPIRGERTKGIIDALRRFGVDVEHFPVTYELNNNIAMAVPEFNRFIRQKTDIKLIVFDHADLTACAPTILQSAGYAPGEINAVGVGLSTESAKALKDGWIDLIIDQQPFLQGYLSVLQIHMSKQFGFSGMHIKTGTVLFTSENIDKVMHLIELGIR